MKIGPVCFVSLTFAVVACSRPYAAPITDVCTQTATKLCPGTPLTGNQNTSLILAETRKRFAVSYPNADIKYQPGVIQLREPTVPGQPAPIPRDSDFVIIRCDAQGINCRARLESTPKESVEPLETSIGDSVTLAQYVQRELNALLKAPATIPLTEQGVPDALELNFYDAIGPGGTAHYAIFSDVAIPEPSTLLLVGTGLLGLVRLRYSQRRQ